MNILTTETKVNGIDKVLVVLTSDLLLFKEERTVLKANLSKIEHKARITIIRTYLSRYVKSRIRAYYAVGAEQDPRVGQLKNFGYHLANHYPHGDHNFYKFIIQWHKLLIYTLPHKENVSNDRVKLILDRCAEHYQSLTPTQS